MLRLKNFLNMSLMELDEFFYLEHSYIHNIGLSNHNKNLIFTINVLNWAQNDFRKNVDPDQIVGNLIFNNVTYLDLDPTTFKFERLHILRVNYSEDDKNKIHFFIEIDNASKFLDITFLTTSVDWILLETYCDRKVII